MKQTTKKNKTKHQTRLYQNKLFGREDLANFSSRAFVPSHKFIFLTNVAQFKREINRLSRYNDLLPKSIVTTKKRYTEHKFPYFLCDVFTYSVSTCLTRKSHTIYKYTILGWEGRIGLCPLHLLYSGVYWDVDNNICVRVDFLKTTCFSEG